MTQMHDGPVHMSEMTAVGLAPTPYPERDYSVWGFAGRTFRRASAPGIVLLFAPLVGLAACGHSRPTSETASSQDEVAQTDSPTERATDADAIPLPELPSATAEQVRRAPSITSVATATQALDQGYYEEVAAALPGLGDAPEVALLRGRYLFETGDYAAAAAASRAAASNAQHRAAALTLQAEALNASGDIAGAERLLRQLENNGDAHRAHLMLGRVLQRQGRTAEAENAFMMLIQRVQPRLDHEIQCGGDGVCCNRGSSVGESSRGE